MNIAIVGSGIAGLTSAFLLNRRHEITVFEAAGALGGHARTVRVETASGSHDVDTGFVVFNEATYPGFIRLLDLLGVPSQPAGMSFSVSSGDGGFEYCGTSLSTLFADRRSLVRPRFLRMLVDVVRFNRRAKRLLGEGIGAPTLRQVVGTGGYSRAFVEDYLVPMGAAIWSSAPARILDLPASFFIRFFHQHGLLSATRQLPWRTVAGGARRYVDALTRPFADRIRVNSPVRSIRRDAAGVSIATAEGGTERFDHVILAAHADQSLRLLADPSEPERDILAKFPFQSNEAALHIDDSVLPRRPAARASWNYHRASADADRVAVTYDMTRLQSLDTRESVCVSLNLDGRLRQDRVLDRTRFDHPVFTVAGVEAQARHAEISGVRRTHYCGAYWRNGFHEDGVQSALTVCRYFGAGL